ncbi:MAG: hypothetical protein ICV59_01640 [Thermoleophilia bacterium]|nr:hypothetical protein [Thermoleophilia bacterium]
MLYERSLGYVPVKSRRDQRADAVTTLVRDGAVELADARWAVADDHDFDACVSVVALARLAAADALTPRYVDPLAEGAILGV